MDYEKQYKEALEKAEKLKSEYYSNKGSNCYFIDDLENIFPELKVDEDETIRKCLINCIEEWENGREYFISHKNVLAKIKDWLENQKDKPQIKWNEYDEKMFNTFIVELTRIAMTSRTDTTSHNYTFAGEVEWLKSIRDRIKNK